MNEDACAAADGKSGCILTHLLRLSANMVYLSPKNFEFCSFECEYIMYTVCKARAWQQWHYIRRLVKKRMARADAAWLTWLHRAQISYALRPRFFRYVSLRMHVLESIQFHTFVHAENGRCWCSHAHQHVASSMVARAHKYAMIARREYRFWTPKHPRQTPLQCPKQAGQHNIK